MILQESQDVPFHTEWWFRILVTFLLATFLYLWTTYTEDLSSGRSESESVSPRSQRCDRLQHSRLVARENGEHDLLLQEEIMCSKKEDYTLPLDAGAGFAERCTQHAIKDGDVPFDEGVARGIETRPSKSLNSYQFDKLEEVDAQETLASRLEPIQIHIEEMVPTPGEPSVPSEVNTAPDACQNCDSALTIKEDVSEFAMEEPPIDSSTRDVASRKSTLLIANEPTTRVEMPEPKTKRAPEIPLSQRDPSSLRDSGDFSSSSAAASQIVSDGHPGMDAFYYWWDVQTSLFRIYTIARTDGVDVVPPYNPSSRRGVTAVALKVSNGTKNAIGVYWVDHKGKHVPKGKIHPGSTWNQSTWIDHPWVFCRSDTEEPLMYYIPYRIIPTTKQEPTVDESEPNIGTHRFTIYTSTTGSVEACRIADPVLPFPAKEFFLTSEIAIAWTLLHCHRMSYSMVIEWNTLIKYLSKIVHHPEKPKYRKLRLSNPNFQPVWNSPLQGLLLAVGFVEYHEFLFLDKQDECLSRQRVQEVSKLVYNLEQWKDFHEHEANTIPRQPEGADGFGRQGFGRPGLNFI